MKNEIEIYLINTVTSKYPNYESDNNFTKCKLFAFQKCLENEEVSKFLQSFSVGFENLTKKKITADDIINIAYSYKLNPKETKELKVNNIVFYLELVKGIKLNGIFMLNSVIISNEIIEKMKIVRKIINNEEEFREYNDELLARGLLRYKILESCGVEKEIAIEKIKNEIINSFDKKIMESNIPIINKNHTKKLKQA